MVRCCINFWNLIDGVFVFCNVVKWCFMRGCWMIEMCGEESSLDILLFLVVVRNGVGYLGIFGVVDFCWLYLLVFYWIRLCNMWRFKILRFFLLCLFLGVLRYIGILEKCLLLSNYWKGESFILFLLMCLCWLICEFNGFLLLLRWNVLICERFIVLLSLVIVVL